jgi:hypothetical protein
MLDSKAMVPIMVTVNELVTVGVPGHEVVSKALISIYDHIPEAPTSSSSAMPLNSGLLIRTSIRRYFSQLHNFLPNCCSLCPIVDLLILLIKAL